MNDSSAAFAAALAVLLARNASGGVLASGIADLGGATLALSGGVFRLDVPIIIPAGFGNVRIAGGSLRAGAGFPLGRSQIELGELGGCAGEMCNVDVSLDGLLLDGGQRARGGVWARDTFGAVLSSLYVINFTTAGVDIVGGHEVQLTNSWLANVPLGDPRRENATFSAGTTGVALAGNDHYLSDVICFGAAVGLNISGEANLVRGFHVWGLSSPFGGLGIVVAAPQTRLEGVYLDGSPLLITTPSSVAVLDSFFLCSGVNRSGELWPQVVIDPTATGGRVDGLTVTGCTFAGWFCQPFALRGIPVAHVAANAIAGNSVNGATAPALSATVTVGAASPTTTFSVDFAPLLLFGNQTLASVSYTLLLPAGSFARSAARPPVGARVVVETDVPIVGSVTITASH